MTAQKNTYEPSTWHANFVISHVEKVRYEVTISRDTAIEILNSTDLDLDVTEPQLDHLQGLDDDELLEALRDYYEENDVIYEAIRGLVPPRVSGTPEELENYIKIVKDYDY